MARKNLLDAREVMEILSCSRSMVNYYISRGFLQPLCSERRRDGKPTKLYFRKSEVLALKARLKRRTRRRGRKPAPSEF